MTNYPAITMFFLFVFGTLIITYWAAKRTKSRAHFYAAGGKITPWEGDDLLNTNSIIASGDPYLHDICREFLKAK